MTDDFIFAIPDAPKFVGKPTALAAAKAGFFDPFTLKIASKFEDVQIFGSQAFAHGSFTLDMIPKAGGGPTIRAPGKFSNFFRKEPDGSWHFALVIFSYDQPPAPLPESMPAGLADICAAWGYPHPDNEPSSVG